MEMARLIKIIRGYSPANIAYYWQVLSCADVFSKTINVFHNMPKLKKAERAFDPSLKLSLNISVVS